MHKTHIVSANLQDKFLLTLTNTTPLQDENGFAKQQWIGNQYSKIEFQTRSQWPQLLLLLRIYFQIKQPWRYKEGNYNQSEWPKRLLEAAKLHNTKVDALGLITIVKAFIQLELHIYQRKERFHRKSANKSKHIPTMKLLNFFYFVGKRGYQDTLTEHCPPSFHVLLLNPFVVAVACHFCYYCGTFETRHFQDISHYDVTYWMESILRRSVVPYY